MTRSTDRYSLQLGCNVTNALRLLARKMLFSFAQELGRDTCCRCGQKIEHFREMSLDHQVNWINSLAAPELFWDVNNVKLSHTKCNVREVADRRRNPVQKLASHNRRTKAHYLRVTHRKFRSPFE